MLDTNVIKFPEPPFVVITGDEPNWFTEAVERLENGEEPFPEEE